MSENQQLTTQVAELLTRLLKTPITTESTRENTEQWDSLNHVQVVFALEDEFQYQFTEQEMETLDSVQAIVEVLNRKQNAA